MRAISIRYSELKTKERQGKYEGNINLMQCFKLRSECKLFMKFNLKELQN